MIEMDISKEYALQGVVERIEPRKEFMAGSVPMESQLLVVMVRNGRINEFIPIEFYNQRIGLLRGVTAGKEVRVSFKVKGKMSKNSERAWITFEAVNLLS